MRNLLIALGFVMILSCARLVPYKQVDIVFIAYSNGTGGIYGANLSTGKIFPLYKGSQKVIPMSPSLNSLHNMLLFISNQGTYYNIYMLNLNSESLNRLTPDDTNYGAPTFCFNKKIVYVTYRSGNLPQIYQMNMDGTSPGLIISEPDGATDPVCNDNEIAYISDPLGSAELKIYNIVTGVSTATGVHGVSSRPAFSPDGTGIVYSRLNHNGYQALYILNLSTMSSTSLLSGNYDAYEPSWGMNNKIAFTTTKDGQLTPDIYQINPDGTGLKRLINYGDADGNPSW